MTARTLLAAALVGLACAGPARAQQADALRDREQRRAWLLGDPTSPRFAISRTPLGTGLSLGPADADVPLGGVARQRLVPAPGGARLEGGASSGLLRAGGVLAVGAYRLRLEDGAAGRTVVAFAPRSDAPAPAWWPYAPGAASTVPLVPPPARASLRLMGPDGREALAEEAGTVRLAIGGGAATLAVRAFPGDDPEERELLVYFQDATNDAGSYPAGRWLALEPAGDGRVRVDLNRAFNPHCAYSSAFPCPVPWRGNRVATRVEAGEQYVLRKASLPALPPPTRLAGPWRAQLDLAGAPLRFTLELSGRGATLAARFCNGGSCEPVTSARLVGDSLLLRHEEYDATVALAIRGDSLTGLYRNVGNRGPRVIPVRAARGRWPVERPSPRLAGRWDAWLEGGTAPSPRVFELRDTPRGVEGTVITNSGDYGTFWGGAQGDSVWFGHFDGAFVYLVTAHLEGDTLRGTFHAGLRTQTPFRATRSTGARHLVPPTELVQADTAPFRFAFRDLDGRLVTQDDARFRGKVVLVDLFGTWCPTCHEAAPVLADLRRRYGARGLEVVGLAYEVSGDTAQDAALVRRYRDKFALDFPLLLAGVNVTEAVQASQPQLRNAGAFPTTLFLGRDGRVRRVHAGFYGPATGAAHARLVEEFRREVERLLAER
ncbi:MAG: DUF1684 domain-containing protein [Gemmatimonadales bacterium]|nr:DUF1684 domain-containing protein [Gemmatimonadales bacterium]